MGTEQGVIKYAHESQYVGALTNNVPHGHGKVSFKDKASFDGDFKEGQPLFGVMKARHYNYEGPLLNGAMHGKGTLIDEKNIVYEGEFEKNKLAKGIISKKDHQNRLLFRYVGEFNENHQLKGSGTFEATTIKIVDKLFTDELVHAQGTFLQGKLHGTAKYTFGNNAVYEGQFQAGLRSGKGEYKDSEFRLLANFKQDQAVGSAGIEFTNGDRYIGQMKANQIEGKGKYEYKNGTICEGNFKAGKLWGNCCIKFQPTSSIEKYEGEMNDGLFNGEGTLHYTNGIVYKGFFLQGTKSGKGQLHFSGAKYSCEFSHDQLQGEMVKK